ncbi:unnamed protein product [Sphagnum jensenii]|uniref:Uncharacterized protein n=1 Tax=Sphagnum jensenii TaxID=128206 RepID=A0ABP1A0L2_9BRYO
MMNLCSDPEEQRNLKLNECLLVTDRIREAGCSDRQGSGKLGSSKRNPNGDGGGTSTSLMPSSWDTPSARDLVTLPVQGPGSIPSETSTPLPGSARPPEKSSADRSPAPSVTPKEQTKYLKRRGETRKGHLRSDGRTRGFNSQRLLSSTAPEEEEAQLDQRPTEFSGSSHLPQVPQKSPPLLSGSELSSDATRKSVGSAVPSAEATKLTTREDLSYARAPASGARTTQKRQAAPAVRERPPPSLNAHPGSGPGAPSLLGEGTQGPSPIDYNLEIEADFPPDMVLDMQRSAAQKAHKTVQARCQGMPPPRMELASRTRQGRDGMYHPRPYTHTHKRNQRTKQVQNKRHLHWKETDSITIMNNEAEFAAEAHDLLLKNGPSCIDHQTYKHRMASTLASLQAARKRRYIRLDLGSVESNLTAEANPF